MSAYDDLVNDVGPVLYLPAGDYPASTLLPNGDRAFDFDHGESAFDRALEVSSRPGLSIPTTGALTISLWIQPYSFAGTGYVHFLGKGAPQEHEYVFRLYGSSSDRPKRLSCYAFNPAGGLGSGAFFEDDLVPFEWVFVVAEYTMTEMKLYKNGLLRDTKPMKQKSSDVTPIIGVAPLRIGTRDGASYFDGAIGKVAVFDKLLGSELIQGHFAAMVGP